MKQPIHTLYLSYDGMTDNLGQSQVLPYLLNIAEAGYHITLISFEKREKFQRRKDEIEGLVAGKNISWEPLIYTKNPPIISTIWDLLKLRWKIQALRNNKSFVLVHCRGAITSIIGLWMKRKFGTKFLYDMRAFFADERIDGGHWDQSKWIYRKVYHFFKKKEKQFLEEADYSISLTEAGKEIIHSWDKISNQPVPIEVIPCCADLQHFSKAQVNQQKVAELRSTLNISESEFVISYLGSVGTWYLLDEMLAFFKRLSIKKPNSRFLFITPDDPEMIYNAAEKLDISREKLTITFSPRDEVPNYLSLSQASLFFIKPVFSKKGSSPTKHGEILGMEIPVICNAGVGDLDIIVKETQTGLLINEFTEKEYELAVENIDELLKIDKTKLRQAAEKYYSLKNGVKKYISIYDNLLK